MENDPFISEEDEEEFGDNFRRFLVQRHPNPERIGCPDSRILRDIAFRRAVTPETIEEVTSHMMKCSECAMDALNYADEYEKYKQTTEE